ncbi:MAG: MBL fold metallo-hydrolase [Woeseiaceae bacterium]|nr:MBL fold metallo-hydrolase [Woeseiaceae bacterium]
MLHDENATPLRWEFDATPDRGTATEIVPGIHWLRMPLPFSLNHINLWLLRDAGRWTIVDTGVDNDESLAVWQRMAKEVFGRSGVARVIVTHMHPDHSGCAGWLCNEFDAGLWMSREEYLLCRVLAADTGRKAPSTGVEFYRAAGFPEDALDRYQAMFGMFGRLVSELPASYDRLQEGDRIVIDDTEWDILVGRGHSPEHACLFDAQRNLVISGDQILPTISSNVSVFPTEPRANPLKDWLASLRKLKSQLPDDVLVLPAHGRPFRGAHERLDALIAEHVDGLDALRKHCRQPRRVVDVFPALFRNPVPDNQLILATGESIAHLNYLLEAGDMQRERDAAGVDWYVAP